MRPLKSIVTACLASVALLTPVSAQSLIRDTEIEHTLRDYADPLLDAAGLTPANVHLYIIADPSINAFVTGGQNIFLHTGIIIEAETPNQLKGVIAHETGHIAGAHLARVGDGIGAAQVPMFISLGLGLLAAFAGEGGAAGALMASSQQFGALSFMTYSRAQEASADQAALQYLETTGQSPEGLVEFFERFRYQEVMSNARRFPYFRSHPLSSERISILRNNADAADHVNVNDTPEEIANLRRLQGKIYGFLTEPEFVLYRYPRTDQSLPARYARAVAYFRVARLDEARLEIESLIAEEPDNPYFQELYGQMLFETGNIRESIPYHARSVELEPTAPLLRLNLAISQIASDDDSLLEEAEGHLQVALDIEPDNAFAWYQLSIVHQRNGDTALAQLAVAEQAFSVGDADRAVMFAGRARASLDQGTPAWIRATEIETISIPLAAEQRRQRRINLR
ncbi:M48 family metalloprotease [Maricaulis salignorans]|uniref:Putative Zn-dependent protease, contains TPR repeats n=1 Tax=Maricaulis salignorans TaxID=144026 RepID=A0A1G9UHM5_9PROT|nr:M48 family metalloprotease [Maricaulis salignorans]SDM59396.1 Putative Zn-dependent protease, contains TPR repeats [Maricaulis salignorans]